MECCTHASRAAVLRHKTHVGVEPAGMLAENTHVYLEYQYNITTLHYIIIIIITSVQYPYSTQTAYHINIKI